MIQAKLKIYSRGGDDYLAEIWMQIPGYPNYSISNYGNVYSWNVHRVMKQWSTRRNNGYKLITLMKNNEAKYCLVHRLVYETFVGEIPDGMEINHIDENKTNNHLDNLEVVTRSENIKHGTATKRRIETRRSTQGEHWSEQLRKPCKNETTGETYPSVTEAAKQTGGVRSSIGNACLKKRKTYKKQIWSYLEGEK